MQGVRGPEVGGDPDMVADLVEGLLCNRGRTAVLRGVRVMAAAAVGAFKAW
jgi:hypothetical protein